MGSLEVKTMIEDLTALRSLNRNLEQSYASAPWSCKEKAQKRSIDVDTSLFSIKPSKKGYEILKSWEM